MIAVGQAQQHCQDEHSLKKEKTASQLKGCRKKVRRESYDIETKNESMQVSTVSSKKNIEKQLRNQKLESSELGRRTHKFGPTAQFSDFMAFEANFGPVGWASDPKPSMSNE